MPVLTLVFHQSYKRHKTLTKEGTRGLYAFLDSIQPRGKGGCLSKTLALGFVGKYFTLFFVQ